MSLGDMINQAPLMLNQMSADMSRMVDYMGELRILAFVVTATSFIGGFIFAMMKFAEMRANKRREKQFEQQFGMMLPPQGYDIRGLVALRNMQQQLPLYEPPQQRYRGGNGYAPSHYGGTTARPYMNGTIRSTTALGHKDLKDNGSVYNGDIVGMTQQPRQSMTNGSVLNGYSADPLLNGHLNNGTVQEEC